MKNVVMHIQAVEAGSGHNMWVNNRLDQLVEEAARRDVAHVEQQEFLVSGVGVGGASRRH